MIHVQDEARQSISSRLADARTRTDELFEVVKPAALYARPIPERHRIIFYLGHVEAFDWNLLRDNLPQLSSFNKVFDKLFAFGIDPVDGGLPSDKPEDWPSRLQVDGYNHRVRQSIDAGLENLAPADWIENGHSSHFPVSTLLNVAIEHRLMHAETLAYMLHQLPLNQKITPKFVPPEPGFSFEPHMMKVPAGSVTLGLSRSDGGFGWDNEYESFSLDVPEFEIDAYKVTNGQFLQFMSEGGYENRGYWAEADWKWIKEHGITHPVFWQRSGDNWRYRAMFEEIALPMDWPVYVSHAEASAYARWAGKTLPSEAQWQRAAYGRPPQLERTAAGNGRALGLSGAGNFDFLSWDPIPVNAQSGGRSAFGVSGMAGNGWEWTLTVFGPFPGFQQFPFYPGYSANFFDGQHYVMKGGSARTAACMMRPSFRNWFQPHYQYAYAGFRCINK